MLEVFLRELLHQELQKAREEERERIESIEAEKEMLSHIKDIEVNRKQTELGNIISGAILDGQNQIHDLHKEKATAQEVEYRMRRSYTYWMNKLHQELQKARHGWLRKEIVKLEGMKITTMVGIGLDEDEQAHNQALTDAQRLLGEDNK
jgi:hypothetical protein